MQIHHRSIAVALAIVSALSANVADATPVNIINQCGKSIELWDNSVLQVMAPGQVITRVISNGFHGMFRAGVNPQATLAELTIDGGKLWYDISIIPTGPKSGPEYCSSLQACKDYTGGVGYNVPMQIAPKGCQTRTCTYDGCPDAYQFPKDDGKTTSCTENTTVDLTFCPGGPGGSTPAPTTQAPTPPPTTQAPTPPPTTQAPTPPPTTQAPTPPPTTQAPTPPPTTAAPTPEPTTQAPTPPPTTVAPTPEPTTQAPTPKPTTEAPIPEPTADPQLLALLGVHNADGSSSSSSTSSSSSVGSSVSNSAANESDQLEAGVIGSEASTPTSTQVTSVVLNPIHADSTSTGADSATSAGDNSQQASTQSASESSGSVGTTLLIVLGGVACVAGSVVFVAMKKKKQLEESETKRDDSIFSPQEGMLTPIDDIQCI